MSKNIDADRLKEEFQKRFDICKRVSEDDRNALDTQEWYRGKYTAYSECLSFIDSLQQEQPEVNLEKFTEKIKTFQGRYKHPEIISIKGAMAFMARMFYQYPNVARQWYEKLRKVTMD